MTVPTIEAVQLGQCEFEAKVKVGGSGPPLVWFHAAGGPHWDVLLDALAEHFTVYAPDHPGTGDTDRKSIYDVDSLWDLVLIYDELIEALGLSGAALAGTSFGGMMACELAAQRRDRVSKLVVLDPLGLWRDDAPVAQYMLMPQDQLVTTLFSNLEAEPVKEFLTPPAESEQAAVQIADLVWAFGSTGKFVWPIPDKGLKKRLHRVTAPTLILWGEDDALVSSVYAEEFASRIAGSRVEIIPGAGHVPQWEQFDIVCPLVVEFLAD